MAFLWLRRKGRIILEKKNGFVPLSRDDECTATCCAVRRCPASASVARQVLRSSASLRTFRAQDRPPPCGDKRAAKSCPRGLPSAEFLPGEPGPRRGFDAVRLVTRQCVSFGEDGRDERRMTSEEMIMGGLFQRKATWIALIGMNVLGYRRATVYPQLPFSGGSCGNGQ
jgi:hypothetical protein